MLASRIGRLIRLKLDNRDIDAYRLAAGYSMAIRFYLSLRRSLMAGSVAAALVAMALVLAVIATFSQMCAAAELDDSSAEPASTETATAPASAVSVPNVPNAPGTPGAQAETSGQT